MPRSGLGNAADRADDERRANVLELAVDRHHLAVLDARLLETKARRGDPPSIAHPIGTSRGLVSKEYFCIAFSRILRRVASNFWARAAIGVGRRLDERHVLDTPAVVQRGPSQTERFPGETVLGENGGNARVLEAQHVLANAALLERRAHDLELQHLHHVDRRQPAADDDRAVRGLVARAAIVALVEVVEPVDERVLIEQPAIDEGVGSLDRQRPIAPGAEGEDHRRESPVPCQIGEVEVATDLGQRDEVDIRTVEPLIDGLVFLLPQLDVPARQAVLDLAVGARVLFEHHDDDAAICEHGRSLRARRCTPHDGYDVPVRTHVGGP